MMNYRAKLEISRSGVKRDPADHLTAAELSDLVDAWTEPGWTCSPRLRLEIRKTFQRRDTWRQAA